MDFRLLEEITVFARHLNYSQAAKELYISQPALSQHVAKVESELGFGLFSHDGTNRPTLAGQVFCSEIGGLLASWNDLVERCARIAAQEAQSVRVLDLRMSLRSLNACSGDGATYVPCDSVRSASEFDVLDRGDVDVSFAFAPVPDPAWFEERGYVEPTHAYRFVPLEPERCILRVSRSNPLAERGSVTLDELEAYKLVYNDMPLYRTCDDAIREALRATGHSFKSIVGIGNAKTTIISADSQYVGVLIETPINIVGQALEPQLVSVVFDDFDLRIYPFAVVRASDADEAPGRFAQEIARLA